MAELQHTQIKSKMFEKIVPSVDMTDIPRKSDQDTTIHALSRAVAITATMMKADIDLPQAAAALVDGGNDNGIDLIYYDPQAKVLFIIQSKWNTSHHGSIDSASVLKFLQGVQDLVSLKRDRFNEKIQQRWAVIEDALARLVSVRLIVAYSGSTNISDDIQARIDEFVSSQNDTSELFFFEKVSQKELFQYFLQEAAPPKIDLTIRLTHYGIIEAPLKAVYGQVPAVDLAKWYTDYGSQLFSGNIRHFLGIKSDVNAGIARTINEHPELFWYFNNGITLIVQQYTKQALGGNDRSVGLFDCKNVTIVNGAQTVGTLGRTLADNDSAASLLVRIIAVDDPDSDVGKRITRASNTQNRIDARNFAALDPEQERLRTELLIDKIEYEYREGEAIEDRSEGFEFIEAITTLACASSEVSYVALAKGYVGGLYADMTVAPYKALFNPGTSSKRLWSLIRLTRRIDSALRAYHNPGDAVSRGMIVHGNRLLVHLIIRRLSKSFPIESSELVSEMAVSDASKEVFEHVKAILDADYQDAYLAPLFKNVAKCTDIRSKVEA